MAEAELEAAVPDNRVILGNDINMALANSKAPAALGITQGDGTASQGRWRAAGRRWQPDGLITDGFAGIPGSPAPNEIAGRVVYTRQ